MKLFISILTLTCISILHAQNFSDWLYSGAITINTTITGADIPADQTVTDFPLLLRLDKGIFDFTQAQAQGEDIRFAKSNGTPLEYAIESWDSEFGKAVLWIKMDVIAGNSTNSIVMYWGNQDAPG